MSSTEPLTGSSTPGVEDVISELHERGVKSGREEAERIVADARLEAGDIVKSAEKERERMIAEGQREADRIISAAKIESDQMLESFMASVPDLFARRASRMLQDITQVSLDPAQPSATLSGFVDSLDGDREANLKSWFAKSDPRSFMEGLLILTLVFYSREDGLTRFTLDPALRESWARIMGEPASDSSVAFEFKEGIRGFSVSTAEGREVVVSPESIKHMAEAWAGDEFREVYVRLKAQAEASDES
ncbi:MAG: ATP synthase F0 subunit B [Xanthomonadales bacterium]|nr:ATP synthase F0 subunit B [Xanthomonadales bacterium]